MAGQSEFASGVLFLETRGLRVGGLRSRLLRDPGIYEPQSVFTHMSIRHGSLLRKNIRD